MAELKVLKVIQPNESPPFPIATKPPLRTIKIGQLQLNTSFSNQYYFPLASGMIRAYAQKHLAFPDYYRFQPTIYKFMRIEEASEQLSDCDMIVVSSYVWSEQNSLAIAKDFKRRNPNGVVIFGGPQVPDSKKQFRKNKTVELNPEELKRQRIYFTEDYHREHPEIDICCHGEGERVFRYILEQMAIDSCHDKSKVPSISYIDTDGNFHYNSKLERMKNNELAQTSSPFTTGVFDKLMEINPDQRWIIMYETDRGCPFTCTYCDWGGATEDKVSQFPMEQIYNDIMWSGEHKIPYYFLCNANFGILPRDVQIAEFFAECKSKYGTPEGVSTQNSKNPRRHTIEALKILERAGLNKATVMSQQSLNPATLKAVRRDNMDLTEYYAMQKELNAEGVYILTDIILPMPEETLESIIWSVSLLITNGQHSRIQFNNLSILKNTEMANPEYQKMYGFEIVRSKIINIHGKKNTSISGIDEWQDLVVATNTMPPEIWMKTRTFCWATGLYYFNKLLQIPTIILHEEYGVDYGEILKLLSEDFKEYGQFPVLGEVKSIFLQTAQGIRDGKEEYIHAPEYLDIWWPPEEYVFIKMCVENKLGALYQEALRLFSEFLSRKEINKSTDILEESIKLNRSLIKIPFQTEDLQINLSYNIWDAYKTILVGNKLPIILGSYNYIIDRTTKTNSANTNARWDSWEEWYEKMVWWCNRRGAYLYGNMNPHPDLAGHH